MGQASQGFRLWPHSIVTHLFICFISMVVFFWMNGVFFLKQTDAMNLTEQVREQIRTRIEATELPLELTIGKETLHAAEALPLFYEERAYSPAWSGIDGILPQAEALLDAIRGAYREGLRPQDYHLGKIEEILEDNRRSPEGKRQLDAGRLADLDLLLSDSFMIYGSHLLFGRVNSETFEAEWRANRRDNNLAELLQKALTRNRIRTTLESFLPSQQDYKALRRAFEGYRRIVKNGGWPKISQGLNMEKGSEGERVEALRVRLMIEGDLKPVLDAKEAFDDDLKEAVERFQRRYGLTVDGIVGPATLRQLNVPAEQRLRQIELNMERRRWMPRRIGDRYILVNITDFELQLIEKGKAVMTMKVTVGRPHRPTPSFSGTLTYLVLNPFWYVPSIIITEDMLPLIRKNGNFFKDNHILVIRGWGDDAEEIEPEKIDWSAIRVKNFPFRFFQKPGPMNALGRVKFMFPNKFNVYLHDTPSRELFTKKVRDFSSGCVRIEKAVQLIGYLLAKDPDWSRENIQAAIETGLEQTVPIPEPIPVHLVYWTAWVNGDEAVQFRPDIYGWDKRLDVALLKNSAGVKPQE